jgi:formate transporter
MAWASGKVRTRDLLFNWVLVFAGNFVGAILTAVLMFYTTQYTFGGGSVGLAALSTANSKAALALSLKMQILTRNTQSGKTTKHQLT